MIISADSLKMAVIGDPINHSLSPFLHSCLIERTGVDAVYMPFRVGADDTGAFHDYAGKFGFRGFNATMPHKLNLMTIVDELDDSARMYGSVNTVKFSDGRSRGYNTDVSGLLMALKGIGKDCRGSKILVIGAGGVAGSLIRGFAESGAASITVLNRSVDKARRVISICPDDFTISSGRVDGNAVTDNEYTTEFSALPLQIGNLHRCAGDADIILNCTPLGMHGSDSDFEDLHFLDGTHALVCDLIYNPWKTSFLKYAESLDLRIMNGLPMLIYQGMLAFQIFTDTVFDLDNMFNQIYPLCVERMQRTD